MLLRLFDDTDGNSRFDYLEQHFTLHDDSPPEVPHYFTGPIAAKSYVFVRCPIGWGGRLHPTPRRQIVVCTSGALRITSSTGEEQCLRPGTSLLLEDTKGKGHISQVISEEAFEALIVRLE